MRLKIKDKDQLKRFLLQKRVLLPEIDCWIYTGYFAKGYGKIYFEGKNWAITRLSLYVFKDFDINSPLFACHIPTCRRTDCFNPDHLYPGDHVDNMQDRKFSLKATCSQGHKFTKENIYINSFGQRTCKTCKRLLRKNQYLKTGK